MIDDLFADIESEPFKDRAAVASSIDGFMRILLHQPEVHALHDTLSANRGGLTLLCRRLDTLLKRPIDERFISPYDVPVAAYTAACVATFPSLARSLSAHLMRTPNLWWSKRLAESIAAQDRPIRSEDTTIKAGDFGLTTTTRNQVIDIHGGGTIVWASAKNLTRSHDEVVSKEIGLNEVAVSFLTGPVLTQEAVIAVQG